jgi:hypothetical protein
MVGDFTDLQNINRDVCTLSIASKKKYRYFVPCGCRPFSQTSIYLKWPFYLSRKRTTTHRSDCPNASWERVLTDINVRISLCSLALRNSFCFSIILSHLNGEVAIKPTLAIRRVVPTTSPGFSLLLRLTGDEIFVTPDLIEYTTEQLLRLFQIGEVSPYDRLADGSTLLHVS